MNTAVVEFVGLPGSGKSHLAAELLRLLDGRGIAAGSWGLQLNHEWSPRRRVAAKAAWTAGEMLARPRRSLVAGRALARSGQRRRRDALRMWSELLVLSRLVRRARAGERVEVLDEGVFQLLWSVELTGRAGTAQELAPAVAAAAGGGAWPDVLVVVDAPVDVVLARLVGRERPDSRVDRMPPATRRTALERGIQVLDRVTASGALLGRDSRVPHVVRLRNDASNRATDKIAPVVDAVVAVLAQGGGAA